MGWQDAPPTSTTSIRQPSAGKASSTPPSPSGRKHLDPVQSYSEDEASFLYQIVEPPLQYNYLKRPYVLEPATAAAMPSLRRYDRNGRELPETADASRVDRTVVEVRIRPGILYQPHPAFARKEDGEPRYVPMLPEALDGVRAIGGFRAWIRGNWWRRTTCTR
ncbi:hypothetical protein [Thauera humireducens]|uniref:hypothetical protein n=1 Tax=Thauera humireducens TaxID=1134435 RepID=UPI0031203BC2